MYLPTEFVLCCSQILTFLEGGSVTSDLARLSSLEAVLGEAATVTRYPHLTALLFTALLSLSASQARAAGAGKEVARISSRSACLKSV